MIADASQNFMSARVSSILSTIELQGIHNARRATDRLRERCTQLLG